MDAVGSFHRIGIMKFMRRIRCVSIVRSGTKPSLQVSVLGAWDPRYVYQNDHCHKACGVWGQGEGRRFDLAERIHLGFLQYKEKLLKLNCCWGMFRLWRNVQNLIINWQNILCWSTSSGWSDSIYFIYVLNEEGTQK